MPSSKPTVSAPLSISPAQAALFARAKACFGGAERTTDPVHIAPVPSSTSPPAEADGNAAVKNGVVEDPVADFLVPGLLAMVSGESITPMQVKAWRNKVLAKSGCRDDPLLSMLAESACAAHLAALKLTVLAVKNSDPEIVAVYAGAAARLAAEQRRTILAIKSVQVPAAAPVITKISQQNIAAGSQEVSFVEGEVDGDGEMMSRDKSSLGGELGGNLERYSGLSSEREVAGPRGGWTAESASGRATQRRRTAAPA